MDLLQLHYFLELSRTEHVTQTAENLHISQPALSSTIRKLEKELGISLFERTGRNIRLTEYGKVYQDYVREALFSLEQGQKALQRIQDSTYNTIRLGVLSPYVWSDMFAAFKKAYPQVTINRYSMEGDEYIEALQRGEIDMYIGGINGTRSKRLSYETLYTDNMVLLVNRSNPLSSSIQADLRDCGDQKFINLARETSLQKFITTLYEEAGISPQIVMEVDYTLRDEMVAKNYGVSVTTQIAAMQAPFTEVCCIPLSFPTFKRELGMVWVSNMPFSPAIEDFHRFALSYYRG